LQLPHRSGYTNGLGDRYRLSVKYLTDAGVAQG
jgi:hypothetical protein